MSIGRSTWCTLDLRLDLLHDIEQTVALKALFTDPCLSYYVVESHHTPPVSDFRTFVRALEQTQGHAATQGRHFHFVDVSIVHVRGFLYDSSWANQPLQVFLGNSWRSNVDRLRAYDSSNIFFGYVSDCSYTP